MQLVSPALKFDSAKLEAEIHGINLDMRPSLIKPKQIEKYVLKLQKQLQNAIINTSLEVCYNNQLKCETMI